MKNKFKVIFIFTLLIVPIILFKSITRSSFSFYIKGSSESNESKKDVIPNGYRISSEISKCDNGVLSWDSLTDSITFKSSNPSICSVYLEPTEDEVYYSSLSLALTDLYKKTTESSDATIDDAVVSVSPKLNKIKLLKDLTITEEISIMEDTFINLNGQKMTFSSKNIMDSFFKVFDNVRLTLYGKKMGSSIEYISETNVPIFLLGDDSSLNITGGEITIDYEGKSNFSILKDDRDNNASITIENASFKINGENIDLLYSAKPMSIAINNSIFTLSGNSNLSLIDAISISSSVEVDTVDIIYEEKSEKSNMGHLINVPLGNLKLTNSKVVVNSIANENTQPKITAYDLQLKNSTMTCKLNSAVSIIHIINNGEITNFNLFATNDNNYNGLLYDGNGTLIIDSSSIDLQGKATGICLANGEVILSETTINAENIKKQV